MVFTLEGNKAGGCFSPFALVWEKKLAYTVTFEPGAAARSPARRLTAVCR